MLQKIWNFLLFRVSRAKRAVKKISNCLGSEFTEEMLEILLNGMSLVFYISDEYRKNIKHFEAKYLFKSRDGSFTVSAAFKNGKMKVKKGKIEQPQIKIFFKNSNALLNFIFSPKPDLLNAILKQEVTFDGNLNYLYKFAYMANHLRLKGPALL